MTDEEKYIKYLDSLKDSNNENLLECIKSGFKTLVEYQVVGNMSERGVDLMEDVDYSNASEDTLVQYIEKLDSEIEELKSAMQQIDNIADKHDLEEDDKESREELEEGVVIATDGVPVATSDEGQEGDDFRAEKAEEDVESGGSVLGKEPQKVQDVDPRDIEPVETGQRFVKVEECDRGTVDECIRTNKMESSDDELPENIRKGESAGTEANDSEGEMANKQLEDIAEQSDKLAGSFESDEELKAWMQAKITKAHQTIDMIYEFFKDKKDLDEKPSDDTEDTSDEQPIFEK